MNYETMAEAIFNEVRPCGGRFWLELNRLERDHWISITKAAENLIHMPQPDEWCPTCDELKDEIDGLLETMDEIRKLVR